MTNLAEISAFFAKLSQGAACQLMSRDLYRLTKSLSIERQLSLLHGGFGFYIVNCLTMYLLQVSDQACTDITLSLPSLPPPSMRVCPYVPFFRRPPFYSPY